MDPNPQDNEYTLEIAGDPNFTGGCTGIFFCYNQITGSQYTLNFVSTGVKYWRVQAMHGDSSPTLPALSPWSAVRSFTPAVPPAGVQTVQLSRPSVVVGDTGFLSGNAYLTEPAPAGGAVLTLSSSNPAALAVPSSVTVPQNTTGSAAFNLTLGRVTVQTVVTITASYNGSSASASMIILLPALDHLQFANGAGATSAFGGNPAPATAWLNGPAPSGGAVVALSSSDPATAAVPSSMTVAAGATSAPFTVSTQAVRVAENVIITATWQGASATATVNVVPNVAPMLLSPADGGGAAAGTPVTLDWSDVAGATLYMIQVAPSPDFAAPIVNEVAFSSQYTSSSLPARQLWWRSAGHRRDRPDGRVVERPQPRDTISAASAPTREGGPWPTLAASGAGSPAGPLEVEWRAQLHVLRMVDRNLDDGWPVQRQRAPQHGREVRGLLDAPRGQPEGARVLRDVGPGELHAEGPAETALLVHFDQTVAVVAPDDIDVGTRNLCAVSSSCEFIRKPPSPLTATTLRSGWATSRPARRGRRCPWRRNRWR